jgi:hypothetical protein
MRVPQAQPINPISALAFLVALTLGPSVQAQTLPCANTTASSGTTQNSSSTSVSQNAQNVANAAKSLGSLFKKKPADAAATAPCPSTAPAAAPGTPNPGQPNTAAAPAQPDSGQPAPAAAAAPAQGGTAPWQPPSGSPSPAAPAGPLDPSKLPDVLGIHLGAPREDASAMLLKLYPGNPVRPEGPDTVAGMGMINIDLPGKSGSDNVHLEFTLTPGKQKVYYIERAVFYKQHMSRDNVMASLHQKYGQQIYEDTNSGVGAMFWLFDEQGHAIPPDKNSPHSAPYGCDTDEATERMLFLNQQRSYANGSLPPATYCDSLIVLRVTVAEDSLVDRIATVLEDRALLRREVTAAGEALKSQNQQQQQQQLKNAQQAKPNL